MFRAPGTIAPETGTLPARRIWSGRWYRVMASGDFPALLSVIGRHDHQEAAGIVVKDTGSALFGGGRPASHRRAGRAGQRAGSMGGHRLPGCGGVPGLQHDLQPGT